MYINFRSGWYVMFSPEIMIKVKEIMIEKALGLMKKTNFLLLSRKGKLLIPDQSECDILKLKKVMI